MPLLPLVRAECNDNIKNKKNIKKIWMQLVAFWGIDDLTILDFGLNSYKDVSSSASSFLFFFTRLLKSDLNVFLVESFSNAAAV